MLVSLGMAVCCVSIIIATLVIHSTEPTEPTEPSAEQKPSNMTFGSNVEVSFDPEEGIQIVIHDNMGRVLFRSVFTMYKGITSDQIIKVNVLNDLSMHSLCRVSVFKLQGRICNTITRSNPLSLRPNRRRAT